ncbi:hypothetical protein AEQ63_08185 [Pseudomonas sp. RIT-PI-o]|nr:hypothetical protein AEQ63_08185 [Pseudomonas sp. RIT-PI-o]
MCNRWSTSQLVQVDDPDVIVRIIGLLAEDRRVIPIALPIDIKVLAGRGRTVDIRTVAHAIKYRETHFEARTVTRLVEGCLIDDHLDGLLSIRLFLTDRVAQGFTIAIQHDGVERSHQRVGHPGAYTCKRALSVDTFIHCILIHFKHQFGMACLLRKTVHVTRTLVVINDRQRRRSFELHASSLQPVLENVQRTLPFIRSHINDYLLSRLADGDGFVSNPLSVQAHDIGVIVLRGSGGFDEHLHPLGVQISECQRQPGVCIFRSEDWLTHARDSWFFEGLDVHGGHPFPIGIRCDGWRRGISCA